MDTDEKPSDKRAEPKSPATPVKRPEPDVNGNVLPGADENVLPGSDENNFDEDVDRHAEP